MLARRPPAGQRAASTLYQPQSMLEAHADSNSRNAWTYALALILFATIALVLVLRRQRGSRHSGPQALIVLSSQGFPVGSAGAAVTAFRSAGLQIVMSSREGGSASPEAASLQTKEAIAASQEGGKPDPVWLWVLRTAQHGVRPFAQCKPAHFVAVYVTGAPALVRVRARVWVRVRVSPNQP